MLKFKSKYLLALLVIKVILNLVSKVVVFEVYPIDTISLWNQTIEQTMTKGSDMYTIEANGVEPLGSKVYFSLETIEQ